MAYTNEPPENLNEFLAHVKIYIDKLYDKPSKQAIQRILSSSRVEIVKTGQWSKTLHGHAEAIASYFITFDQIGNITPLLKQELKEITYKVLQSQQSGLEVIEVDFIPVMSGMEVSVEEELHAAVVQIEDAGKGIRLPPDLIAKGKEMSEAYLYIYFVENTLRVFIEQVGQSNTLSIPRDVSNTITKNKANEQQSKFLPLRGQSDLYYCDFVQLQQIINNNWEIFKDYFPQRDQHWLRVKVEDMYRVRNLIAHCGYVAKQDLELVRANFKIIVGQLTRPG